MNSAPYLQQYLNVYWLRPITAMWRSINAQAMDGIDFAEPSLDLSCGDGICSFIQAGGELSLDDDIFKAVGNLEKFFSNVDIYDSNSEEYRPTITKKPNYQITVGADWKQNLLDKAETLDFYKELVLHDNNERLPFEDESFKTVFSNSVYWVDSPADLLQEIRRVLRPDGQAVIVLLTKNILDYNTDVFSDYLPDEWLQMIDRGRKANYPLLYDDAGWQAIFDNAGLEVKRVIPQISWVHLHMEDIGLRPISPLLIKMVNALTPEQRREIKAEWIETFDKLLSPFTIPEFNLGVEKPAGEVIYVVSPKQ